MRDDEEDFYEDEIDEDEERYQEFLESYECRCGAIQYGENGAYRIADCVC